VKKWGNLAILVTASSIATAVTPAARGATKMSVLGTQRTTAVRAFVKGCETVQAVNPSHDRLVSFVGNGLWHSSIVDS
jgi:hypothetical protein